MQVDLPDLRLLSCIARHLSFRQAADELGVSASAVSHSLRALEAKLGVRLFNRTTRSVALTEAGQRLLGQVAPALDNIQRALEDINTFRDTPVGRVRLNAPRPAGELVLAPLVAKFLRQYPGVKVDLVLDDALVDIVQAGFDAGVRYGESLQQDMVAIPLGGRQRFVVVASPDYLRQHGPPGSPRELAQFPCIGLRFPSGVLYRWEFEKAGERVEVDVDGPLTLGELSLAVRAAEDGLGLAYVYAQQAAAGLAAGRLVQVLGDWCPEVPGFFLYYPSRRLAPAALRAFIDLVRADTASAG
ncbi:MAG: LysR family transcriptional regulator [Rhodoferax sp.]|nr:LysR family transcriptional regulator [Rhodoferax sp.]